MFKEWEGEDAMEGRKGREGTDESSQSQKKVGQPKEKQKVKVRLRTCVYPPTLSQHIECHHYTRCIIITPK